MFQPIKQIGGLFQYNILSHSNGRKSNISNAPSSFGVFYLKPDTPTLLLLKINDFNIINFDKFKKLILIDHSASLEARRYTLYLEGILLGFLFALALFGWFSGFSNRDKTSFHYGVWIFIALLASATTRMFDGTRFFEFFVNLDGLHNSIGPYTTLLPKFFFCMQDIAFVIFARAFLELKSKFLRLHTTTSLWILWQFTSVYLFDIFNIDFLYRRELNVIFFIGTLTAVYVASIIRYFQGMKIANFFIIAMLPYLFFRVSLYLGAVDIPSPFAGFEPQGLGALLRNRQSFVAIGASCEALIMAFAIISRTRFLNEQLKLSIETKKDFLESQNNLLETTVSERTKEIKEQHIALSHAHQLVVGSVNYASRLQRGQLPRQQRIAGRFESFDVIWEPRDTIGGDLWWISSENRPGPFYLGVADCTGHGVPGAMLSLLVSNSLERIHVGDANPDPARGLMALDHMLRSGLNQDRADSESDDGCDMALLRIDPTAKTMQFAGAKIGLFQLQSDGQVKRHAAARVSLGYQQAPDPKDEPQSQTIAYGADDVFVLVTDGFTDQLGGDPARPRSFGYRPIEAVLSSMPKASASDIVAKLKQDFAQWQGNFKRRDDVTVLVFRILAPA